MDETLPNREIRQEESNFLTDFFDDCIVLNCSHGHISRIRSIRRTVTLNKTEVKNHFLN